MRLTTRDIAKMITLFADYQAKLSDALRQIEL
jgi:hypothetical protein